MALQKGTKWESDDEDARTTDSPMAACTQAP